MTKTLLGKGWAFPPQVDSRGGIALAAYETDIEQAIHVIVGTSPGQRPMRPNFGCRIHELVFAPLNASTVGLVQRHVEEALGWWEPRIDVMQVAVSADSAPDTPGRLLIEIKYRVRATHDERSLVYPFYLTGEE